MDPFIGQIIMFGGNFAPRGWSLCDGQLLSINQNSALFSILGTTYGGDGISTFGLPDLRGRVAVHAGQGPGLSNYSLGQKGGSETVSLTTNQMPSHNHTLGANTQPATQASPAGTVMGMTGPGTGPIYHSDQLDTTMAPDAIANTGGGQSHTNIQPYQCVNFIIALTGTYPSRS